MNAMLRQQIATAVALVAALWGAFNLAHSGPVALSATSSNSQVVLVFADAGWQRYDVAVRPGESLRLKYLNGDWTYWSGNVPPGDANGATGDYHYVCADHMDAMTCEEPVPDAPKGALIAKIGEERPFLVGNELDLVADSGGELWLGINDGLSDTGLSDNFGSIAVSVTVGAANDIQSPTFPDGSPASIVGGWIAMRTVRVCGEGGPAECAEGGNYPMFTSAIAFKEDGQFIEVILDNNNCTTGYYKVQGSRLFIDNSIMYTIDEITADSLKIREMVEVEQPQHRVDEITLIFRRLSGQDVAQKLELSCS